MDKTLKSVSSIANMRCSNCFVKNNFMFFLNNYYYCSKCIDTKNNIKEYKYLI